VADALQRDLLNRIPELNIEFNLPCLLLRFKRRCSRFRKCLTYTSSISGMDTKVGPIASHSC